MTSYGGVNMPTFPTQTPIRCRVVFFRMQKFYFLDRWVRNPLFQKGSIILISFQPSWKSTNTPFSVAYLCPIISRRWNSKTLVVARGNGEQNWAYPLLLWVNFHLFQRGDTQEKSRPGITRLSGRMAVETLIPWPVSATYRTFRAAEKKGERSEHASFYLERSDSRI